MGRSLFSMGVSLLAGQTPTDGLKHKGKDRVGSVKCGMWSVDVDVSIVGCRQTMKRSRRRTRCIVAVRSSCWYAALITLITHQPSAPQKQPNPIHTTYHIPHITHHAHHHTITVAVLVPSAYALCIWKLMRGSGDGAVVVLARPASVGLARRVRVRPRAATTTAAT